MYHISVLTGHQDEDDFGERLSDIAEVEYCSAEDEDELIDQLDGTDILICDDEPVSGRVLEETDDLKLIVVMGEKLLISTYRRHKIVISRSCVFMIILMKMWQIMHVP